MFFYNKVAGKASGRLSCRSLLFAAPIGAAGAAKFSFIKGI